MNTAPASQDPQRAAAPLVKMSCVCHMNIGVSPEEKNKPQ